MLIPIKSLYCCEKFTEHLDNPTGGFGNEGGPIWLAPLENKYYIQPYSDNKNFIRYCPFCGKKLIYKH